MRAFGVCTCTQLPDLSNCMDLCISEKSQTAHAQTNHNGLLGEAVQGYPSLHKPL